MNHEPTGCPIRVGIGLIRRGDRFLIRQRLPGTAMAGYWEFPGGKCEPGESAEQAAARECREETGLKVKLVGPPRVISHRYQHAWVELYYYDGETHDPDEEPSSASGFRWVPASVLLTLTFPEANWSILTALSREFASRECINRHGSDRTGPAGAVPREGIA
jgi:8-oxo-dGTP diphosphatase